MALITEAARRWAGTVADTRVFPVTEADIRRYTTAIGETDPIHLDPDAARSAGHRGLVAPPLFTYVVRMQCFNVVPAAEVEPDGSTKGDTPPVTVQRAMAGETVIELGVPIVAGDRIAVSKTVSDMYEKEGRSGALLFVVFDYHFTNQDDEMVAHETFTRIFR